MKKWPWLLKQKHPLVILEMFIFSAGLSCSSSWLMVLSRILRVLLTLWVLILILSSESFLSLLLCCELILVISYVKGTFTHLLDNLFVLFQSQFAIFVVRVWIIEMIWEEETLNCHIKYAFCICLWCIKDAFCDTYGVKCVFCTCLLCIRRGKYAHLWNEYVKK